MRILTWWKDYQAKKEAERIAEYAKRYTYTQNLILDKVNQYYNDWVDIVKSHNNGNLSNDDIRYYNMSLHIRVFAAVEYNLFIWCSYQSYLSGRLPYKTHIGGNDTKFKKVEKYLDIGGQLGKDVCQQVYADWYKSIDIEACPLIHSLNELRRAIPKLSEMREGIDYAKNSWAARDITKHINKLMTDGAKLLERKL